MNSIENSEKHFASLSHQLLKQAEESRLHLKLAEEKNKRLETDLNTALQKTDYFM